MKTIKTLTIICLFVSCSQAPTVQEDPNANSAFTSEADTFTEIETTETSVSKPADTLNRLQELLICRNIHKTIKKPEDLSKTKVEDFEAVYEGFSKTTKKYLDSTKAMHLYFKLAFSILELNYAKAEAANSIPVDTKLKVASIKSEIHTSLAKMQEKNPVTE